MKTEIEKPNKLNDEHLQYLNELREFGKINMFGAAPFLRRRFSDLSEREAKEILIYWMETF